MFDPGKLPMYGVEAGSTVIKVSTSRLFSRKLKSHDVGPSYPIFIEVTEVSIKTVVELPGVYNALISELLNIICANALYENSRTKISTNFITSLLYLLMNS